MNPQRKHPMESVPDTLLEDLAALEDPREWNGQRQSDPEPMATDPLDPTQAESQSVHAIYRTPCKACRGTGKFYSWSGRLVGPCFKCDGKGFFETKTSPETLKARAQRRTERKERTRNENASAGAHFLETRPDVRDWFAHGLANGNAFAISLSEKLTQYGELTPGQLGCIERDLARTPPPAPAPQVGLDLSTLPSGMYAVPNGETRLKVRIKHPKQGSRWYGFIFVDDGAVYGHGQSYGRQKPGGRYEGKIVPELTAILADPRAAMAAYGHLTNQCGRCGRPLEDATSVELGIGPVCRGKLGW